MGFLFEDAVNIGNRTGKNIDREKAKQEYFAVKDKAADNDGYDQSCFDVDSFSNIEIEKVSILDGADHAARNKKRCHSHEKGLRLGIQSLRMQEDD